MYWQWMIGLTAKEINDKIQDDDTAHYPTVAQLVIKASVTLLCHGDTANARLHDTVQDKVSYWTYHGIVLVVYADDTNAIQVA